MQMRQTGPELARGVYKSWVLATTGIWLSKCVGQWLDYTSHPEWFAAQSAPWWTELVFYTLIFGGQLGVASALYWAAHRWLKNHNIS